jgi:hypothetical protein
MARIIAFDLCPNRSVHVNWGEEAQCYSDNNFSECTQIKNVVDKLINAGYRKKEIPENAVVLTKEEYEELQIGKDFNYGYHNGESNMTSYYENIRLPKVRKETAEKFAERLKEKMHKGKALHATVIGKEYVQRIIRETTNEICKEIIGEEIANAVKGVQNGN